MIKTRRLISLVLTGMMLLTLTGTYEALAVEVSPSYTVKNGVLTDYSGPGGAVAIPGDLGITAIGEKAVYGRSDIKALTVPEGVKTIGKMAFYKCGIISLKLPNSIETIGESAFFGCEELKSIILPEGLRTAGGMSFGSCTALESVTLPASILNVGYSMFDSCSALTKVTIPEGIRGIQGNAFHNCVSLASIRIPESVSYVEGGAFSGCGALKSVTILSNSIQLGMGAFEETALEQPLIVNCGKTLCYVPVSFTDYEVPAGVTKIIGGTFLKCRITTVKIPEGVTEIGAMAFAFCTALKSVTLPESLVTLGDSSFVYCSALKSINMPKKLINVGRHPFLNSGITNPVLSYDGSVLYYLPPDLRRYEAPLSLKKIWIGATTSLSMLEALILPEGFTEIQSLGIQCGSLQAVDLPDSVRIIGEQAFANDTGLRGITIPKGVTAIGDWAFNYCTHLNAVLIPKSVVSIGSNTFSKCTQLTIYGEPGSYAERYAAEKKIPFSPASRTAAPTATLITVNGKAVAFEAYNIDDYNYFRLRDIAAVFSGTSGQFEVSFDAGNGTVSLMADKTYTPVGGELTVSGNGETSAVFANMVVYLGIKACALRAYEIGGYNYVRLRDLCDILGFRVSYNGQTDTAAITTA